MPNWMDFFLKVKAIPNMELHSIQKSVIFTTSCQNYI